MITTTTATTTTTTITITAKKTITTITAHKIKVHIITVPQYHGQVLSKNKQLHKFGLQIL